MNRAHGDAIPHLIHVGLAKTGSVALRAWFAAHPHITYCEGGLGGYASLTDLVQQTVRFGTPSCLVTSSEQFSMPPAIAPDGSFDNDEPIEIWVARRKACCEQLRALFPNSRILIVTRGYGSIIRASYSQYVRTGGELAFASMWQDSDMSTARHMWGYDEVIALYCQAFGAERVLVLPQELMRDDPPAFTRAIEEPLGLSHMDLPLETRNPSLSQEEIAWYPRLTRLTQRVFPRLPMQNLWRRLHLRAIYGGHLRWLARTLQWLSPMPLAPASLSPAQLQHIFADSAKSLIDNPNYRNYRAEYLLEGPG